MLAPSDCDCDCDCDYPPTWTKIQDAIETKVGLSASFKKIISLRQSLSTDEHACCSKAVQGMGLAFFNTQDSILSKPQLVLKDGNISTSKCCLRWVGLAWVLRLSVVCVNRKSEL